MQEEVTGKRCRGRERDAGSVKDARSRENAATRDFLVGSGSLGTMHHVLRSTLSVVDCAEAL